MLGLQHSMAAFLFAVVEVCFFHTLQQGVALCVLVNDCTRSGIHKLHTYA